MKKQLLFTICALLSCFTSFATFTGPSSAVCAGTTGLYYYDSAALGGTFSTSNSSIATINPTTGYATAVGAGTVTISYTTPASITSTLTLVVNPVPAPVVIAVGSICVGDSTTCTCATPGGTWVPGITGFPAQVSAGGTITGLYAGTVGISYVLSGGCSSTSNITIMAPYSGNIIVPATVCLGSATTITDSISGGTWSSSDVLVATVATTGTITGTLSAAGVGTATISYTVVTGCGSATSTAVVSVSNTTSTATISGPSSVVAFSSIYLASSVSGGTWSVSPASVANVNSGGVLSGLTSGTAVVTYTLSGCGGTTTANYTVTVTPFDGICGHVNLTSGASYGRVKVWLISYTSPTLTAEDSVMLYNPGTSGYYAFPNIPAGSYRIKAAMDTIGLTTGYIPTYHTNSFYWNTATVIVHAAGGSDINKDIAMAYGAVTSGAGFIGGDVTTGANKGTASSIPSVGLPVYLYNASSTTPIKMAYTDASGHYAFSNLPVGVTYYTFPEALNYTTTPYSSISLTSAAPLATAASYTQHTLSKTITPIPAGISMLATDAASVMVFPNPTMGKVSLTWQLPSAQDATVTVADITGREVYTTAISMAAGAGISQLNLSTLNNGLYTISVKSADLNYNSKLQVQH